MNNPDSKACGVTESVNAQILHLAWPAIVSNLSVPLLGLSDTFISGHLGSEIFIAAIAVGTMMVNVLYKLMLFLRMGTTGMTAIAFGAGDERQQARVFSRAFCIAVAIGLALLLLSPWLGDALIWLMSPEKDVAVLASRYFFVTVIGGLPLLTTMVCTGRLIGRQNTLYPMIISIAANVINILLSLLLVFVFKTGFIGVAFGTLAANWAGGILALILVKIDSRKAPLFLTWRHIWRGGNQRRFWSVNGDLLLRSACVMAVSFAMTAFGARISTMTLAINAVLMQFFLFFSYFMDGFAFAGEAMCGRYAGLKNRALLISTIKWLSVWTTLMGMVFFIIYLFGCRPIASLITDEKEVVDGVGRLVWVVALIPLLSGFAFMLDGVYVGLTRTGRMLMATLVGMVLFFSGEFLPQNLAPSPESANTVLWGAFLLFLTMRGFILAMLTPNTLSQSIETPNS